MEPTPEQISVLDLLKSTKSNILIQALAGTGKTTTLELIQATPKVGPVICLAFNKRIAETMEKRFLSTTTVRTFNGLGHRVWAKAVGKANLNPKKTQDHLSTIIDGLKGDDRREVREKYMDIVGGVNLAKSLGYVPEGKFDHAKRLLSTGEFHASLEERPSSLVREIIDGLLTSSIKSAYEGSIDFNDQIYMPSLFGGTFPNFPLTLVDEAQDLSPTNHAMLDKLAKNRICAVGDPWQSIYGFRGAVQSGMEKLKQKFSMEPRTISVSFRCPKTIVEAVHWRVPDFKWARTGGHYESLPELDGSTIPEDATILCRNNAPLFRIAFDLLAHKRPVKVNGSEIGPRLIRLMQRIGHDNDTQKMFLSKIEAWKDEKLGSTQSASTIWDQYECMKLFARHGNSVSQAVAYAEHLFAQQGTITLMTGHKAKGGEWDTVYHLDPWLIGDSEQEKNLRYVISTRAKENLFEIDSKGIRW